MPIQIKKTDIKKIDKNIWSEISNYSDAEFDYFIEFLNVNKLDELQPGNLKLFYEEFLEVKKSNELESFLEKRKQFVDFRRLIKHNIFQYANEVAVSFEEEAINYAELGNSTRKICIYLKNSGIEKGDVVAIYLPGQINLIPSLLAVMQLGAAFVLLDDPRKTNGETRLKECLELVQTYCHEEAKKNFCLLTSDKDNYLFESKIVNENDFDRRIYVADAKKLSDDFIELVPIEETSLAYITFTSGSTGKPKGVWVPYAGIFNRVAAHIEVEEYKITNKDGFSQFCPLDVDAAILEILIPLLSGGRLILMPQTIRENYSDRFEKYFSRKNITASIFTPSVLEVFHQLELKLESLKIIFCVGENVSSELLDYFVGQGQGKIIVIGYGLSEATIASSLVVYCKGSGVHIGKGLPGVVMRLWDGQQFLDPVENNEGEIIIGGIGIAPKYIGASKEDNDRFFKVNDKDYYLTGDRGKYKDEGNIYFLGRENKNQFKVCERIVNIQEIQKAFTENVLPENFTIEKISYPDNNITVAINVSGQENFDPQQCIYDIANKLKKYGGLADYAFPSRWVVSLFFPLKEEQVNWKKIKTVYLANNPIQFKRNESNELRAIENKLVELWEDIFLTQEERNLKQLHISVKDDFFILGGNSLKYIILKTKFEKIFENVSFPENMFRHNSTIELLARHVQRTHIRQKIINPLNVQAKKCKNVSVSKALFCMHALLGDANFNYGALSEKFPEYEVFGLSSWGLEGVELLPADFQELVYSYVEVISSIKAPGPYMLVGWSFGGIVMHAVAKQLRDQNEIASAIILDSVCPKALMNNIGPEDFFRYIQKLAKLTWNCALKYSSAYKDIYEFSEVFTSFPGWDGLNGAEAKRTLVEEIFDLLIENASEKKFSEKKAEIQKIIKMAKQNVLLAIGYIEDELHSNDLLFVAEKTTANGFENVENLGWQRNYARVVSVPGNHLAMIRSEKNEKKEDSLEKICAELKSRLPELEKGSPTLFRKVYDFFKENPKKIIFVLFLILLIFVGVGFYWRNRSTEYKSNKQSIVPSPNLPNDLIVSCYEPVRYEMEVSKKFEVSDLDCTDNRESIKSGAILCIDNSGPVAKTPIFRSEKNINFFNHKENFNVRLVVGPASAGKTEMIKGSVKHYYREVRGMSLVWRSRDPETLTESAKELAENFGYKKEDMGSQNSAASIVKNLNKDIAKYSKIILIFDKVKEYEKGSEIQKFAEAFSTKTNQVEVLLISRKLINTISYDNTVDLSDGLNAEDSVRFLMRLNKQLSYEDAKKYVDMFRKDRYPYFLQILAVKLYRHEIKSPDELRNIILEGGGAALIQQQIVGLSDNARKFLQCFGVLNGESISLSLLENVYKQIFNTNVTGKDFRLMIDELNEELLLLRTETEHVYSITSIAQKYLQTTFSKENSENINKIVSLVLQQFPYHGDGSPKAMQVRVVLFSHLKSINHFLVNENVKLPDDLKAEFYLTLSDTYFYLGKSDEILTYINIPFEYWSKNVHGNENNLIKVCNLYSYALRYSKNSSMAIEALSNSGFEIEKTSKVMDGKQWGIAMLKKAMKTYDDSSNKEELIDIAITWNDYTFAARVKAETAHDFLIKSIKLKKQNLPLCSSELPIYFFNLARSYVALGNKDSAHVCYVAAINNGYNLSKSCIDAELLHFFSYFGEFKDRIGETKVGRNMLVAVDSMFKKIEWHSTKVVKFTADHQKNWSLVYARNGELKSAIELLRSAIELYNSINNSYPELNEGLDCLERIQNIWSSRFTFWHQKEEREEVKKCLSIVSPESTLPLANVYEVNECEEYAQVRVDSVIKKCFTL